MYYKNRKRSVIELTAKELKEILQKKKNLGQDTPEDIMNYHMKFAIAFVSLIYALLGLPIGLKPFFKQKTAYVILRSDWSSDVCSSD
eukprot:COSAG05_NODE_15688_length_364_cov_0.494340_1_plen_86_part_10